MSKKQLLQITPSDQVRNLVRSLGVSQRDLAKRCGFSGHSTITAFLAGKSITTGNLDRIFAAAQEILRNKTTS
jgi:transcriptional regulator with XRE-family HTH domain